MLSAGSIRTAGVDVAYDPGGDGPPLVLVHGAAGDSREWRALITDLASDFTVIPWDERGAGRSSNVPADSGPTGYASTFFGACRHARPAGTRLRSVTGRAP
jgi:pimeloyl-ACP methyl ester carboxylesterase